MYKEQLQYIWRLEELFRSIMATFTPLEVQPPQPS